jgi:hypothetical protein
MSGQLLPQGSHWAVEPAKQLHIITGALGAYHRTSPVVEQASREPTDVGFFGTFSDG